MKFDVFCPCAINVNQLIPFLDLVVIFRFACTTVSILFRNLNVSSLLKISVLG